MAGISIQNVYKNYGALNVLKEFSLEIEDREFVVLVGPSVAASRRCSDTCRARDGKRRQDHDR